MPVWKLRIFVNAIRRRASDENKSYGDILAEYTRLTAGEKEEILEALSNS